MSSLGKTKIDWEALLIVNHLRHWLGYRHMVDSIVETINQLHKKSQKESLKNKIKQNLARIAELEKALNKEC